MREVFFDALTKMGKAAGETYIGYVRKIDELYNKYNKALDEKKNEQLR